MTKENKFQVEAINKMMEVAGHEVRYEDIMKHEKFLDEIDLYSADPEKEEKPEEWYLLYTWNKEQEQEFRKWFVLKYCTTFKKNKRKGIDSGESVFNIWNMNFGLKLDILEGKNK